LDPGCTTLARARGLCFKHGGGSQAVCVHLSGCTTKSSARGLCVKHGGSTRGVCGHPGCTTAAKARGLCQKHGGAGKITPCHVPVEGERERGLRREGEKGIDALV
jgi:hypothetical protein